jgi:hypothetical protein
MQIMFDVISFTNETSYVPSSGGGGGACGGAIGGEDNNEVERNLHLSNNPNILPNSGKRPNVPIRERRRSPLEMCVGSV